MPYYIPVEENIYIGRKSAQRAYVHERLQLIDLNDDLKVINTPNITYIGYACDAGVRRNRGRVGAKDGPDHVRQQWARLPWHGSELKLFDAGTICCDDDDLEGTQEALGKAIYRLLRAGYFPLVIGGGHDMSYGHFLGINRFLKGEKTLGIINFDAHLDLRIPNPQANSGTPFHQIHDVLESDGMRFRYACLGMRMDANAPDLIERAKEWDCLIIGRDQFHPMEWEYLRNQLEAFVAEVDQLLLTIDMDGFSSAFAPGVSAASPMGFAPDIVLRCLDYLAGSGKIISMDIAETNPEYDRDDQTAKLAASLIHSFGSMLASR